MKILKSALSLFLIIGLYTTNNAQSPSSFNYQAVLRDANDVVLTNHNVGLRTSILENSQSGATVYSEEHNVTSNTFGLVNVKIGEGSVLSGSFDEIEWANGVFYIKLEIDLAGGTTYQHLGTTQLITVPYAKYADKAGQATFPAGMIIAFGGDTTNIPDGWLLCDGGEISRTTYINLFNAITINWGEGNGVSTFNLPDLRGYFLRGADLGAGNDPDFDSRTGGSTNEKIGSSQEDEFGSHNHGGGNHSHTLTENPIGYDTGNGSGVPIGVGGQGHWTSINNSGTIIDSNGGSETRPKNAYVNYIIKY